MKTINIAINPELLVVVDKEMKKKKYTNRSEFFRDLIRKQFLEKQQSEEELFYKMLMNKNLSFWNNPEDDDIFKS